MINMGRRAGDVMKTINSNEPMFTNLMTDTINKIFEKDKNIILSKLRSHLNKEIHIKIENDDTPAAYILKEVRKDCITVHIAQFHRIIPINRIVYIQINDCSTS